MKKYSKQRELILDTLRNRKDHPTVDMLYQDLKPIMPNIGIATIYRNISELYEEGQIKKIKCKEGPDRYDGNEIQHIHFECEGCQQIFDIEVSKEEAKIISNELEKLTKTINAKYDNNEIWLSGLCSNCKNN